MPRVIADFIGRWTIERTITQIGAPQANFHGHAVFTPDGGELRYHEAGVLTIEGQSAMQAERQYRWDDDLNVYFDDGRFFHTVPPMGGQTRHWCDPDDYVVAYDFSAWPHWSAQWRVSGPRKNYQMLSAYRKAA